MLPDWPPCLPLSKPAHDIIQDNLLSQGQLIGECHPLCNIASGVTIIGIRVRTSPHHCGRAWHQYFAYH